MLRIRGKWITTWVDKAIQDRKGEYDIKKYLIARLAITEEILEDIDTAAIEAARSVHTWSRTVRTSKMMVRWLPIGAHCHHHGAHNSYCPGCGESGETFEHLFTCPNADLTKLRLSARMKVRRMLRQEKFPWRVIQKWIWEKQQQIGFMEMIKGWITKAWVQVLAEYDDTDPAGQAAKLVTVIWEVVCEPIWEMRNNILAGSDNPTVLKETRTLREKASVGTTTLDLDGVQHRRCGERDKARCRKELRTLDAAKEVYEIECKMRMSGQRVITDWLEKETSLGYRHRRDGHQAISEVAPMIVLGDPRNVL
eukprot:scaffold27915_cov69-Cyclotella_meneghiniana.AAC.1